MNTPQDVRLKVQDVYAKAANGSGASCCSGSGCCGSTEDASSKIAETLGYEAADLAELPDGANLGLGCGNPIAIASLKPGETVLDLGSGAGIDCFLAARRVGPGGKVIGVDMTPTMIQKARINALKTDFTHVEFRLGEIEALPVPDATVDVAISNCVVNLSPEKKRVVSELWRVLRHGGRIALSDVVALTPVSDALRRDLDLHAACISGAATVAEWTRLLTEAGFSHVSIIVSEESKAMVDAWVPGIDLKGQFASARIEAVKPGATT